MSEFDPVLRTTMKASTKSERPANDGFRVIVLIILLTLIRSANLHAQTNDMEFERISIEQGLSQTTVYSIFQGSTGFI